MSRRSASLSPPRRRYRRRSRSRSSSSSDSRSKSPKRAGTKRYLGNIVVHDHRSAGSEVKSNDPALLACRVFIGNLPTDKMVKSDLEDWFNKYGKVIGCSLFRGYGFVQFDTEECARKAVEAEQGSLYKGFKLDVKMAAEGRRNAGSRRRSPPPRDAGFNRTSRDRSPLDDRRRDPFRRDDPYDRPLPPDPRDDPYRRPPPLHPDDPYLRPPLPYRRDPFGPPDPYFRDAMPPPPFERPAPPPPFERPAPPAPPAPAQPERPPYDCVIVLHGRQQMNYGEMVERRMKQSMMSVDIQVLLENESPQVLIDGATRRNIPFAAVINQQNEVHQSITINILHGTPQEHRNMPLDDAMTLVTRNFEQFVKKLCEKEVGPSPSSKAGVIPPDSQLTYLLNLLADGRHLTLDELDKVKGFVDQRRNRMMEAEGKTPNGASMEPSRMNTPPMNNRGPPVRPGAPLSQQLQPADGRKDEVAIIKQQAELQAKILSILNTSTASPGPNPTQSRGGNNMPTQSHKAPGFAETQSVASNRVGTLAGLRNPQQTEQNTGRQFGGGPNQREKQQQQQQGSGSLPLNLDNPNIQKALDNLIQSGPSLIKSISNQSTPMPSGINSSGMQARANEQQMMNRQRGPVPPPQQQMQRPPMHQQPGMRMPNMQQQQMMQQAQQQQMMQMNMMQQQQMQMRPRF